MKKYEVGDKYTYLDILEEKHNGIVCYVDKHTTIIKFNDIIDENNIYTLKEVKKQYSEFEDIFIQSNLDCYMVFNDKEIL